MKHNHSNIKKAKKYLDNNNCIGIPTETVYGLAGNAYSNKAVKKIFSLKKRQKNKGILPLFFSLFLRKQRVLCFFHFSVDMDRKIEVCQIVPF